MGVPKPVPSAKEWAAAPAQPSRVCETCRWIRRNPKAGGFLAQILDKIIKGETARPISEAHRTIAGYGYPYVVNTLQRHVRDCLR